VKHFLIYLVGAVTLVCLSCDSSNDPKPTSEDFFPMQKGIYHIYDVKEITFTLGEPDTVYYQLKTVVVDSFPNNDNTYTYVIHRNKRLDGVEAWTYLDTWSAVANDQELIVTEGNVPFVKLSFPAVEGRAWNGNAYNNLINQSTSQQNDEYKIIARGSNDVFPEGEYVDVEQEDNQEFIVYFDKRIERYTKNVGLVYKETTQLSYCTQNDCLGQQQIESGVVFKQTIVEHGKE
jgi:hypothetical protein